VEENSRKKEHGQAKIGFSRVQAKIGFSRVQGLIVAYILPPHFAGSKRKASKALFWHRDSTMSMYLKRDKQKNTTST